MICRQWRGWATRENADAYERASALTKAADLNAKLMLLHNLEDDNVHFQGTELLVNRLIELGKPFDMMEYPNRTHEISEGPGTSVHIYRLIARYFLEHLQPRDRASD